MTQRSVCVLKLSLDADALSRAGQAFDESWSAIATDYSDDEVETARTRLATLVLGLSADGSRDLEQIKAAALDFLSREPCPAKLLH